jgi:hypothetical protein
MKPGGLVIVDSTGLKGTDEWRQEKHDVAARRTWRKLHLAVDEHHQIVACERTTPEVGDPTAVPDLLTQMLAFGDTQRDQHIQVIAQQGRLGWQKITGYNLRNYAELAVRRYKRIFGNTIKARALPQQKTEACFSVSTEPNDTPQYGSVREKLESSEHGGALLKFFFIQQRPVNRASSVRWLMQASPSSPSSFSSANCLTTFPLCSNPTPRTLNR